MVPPAHYMINRTFKLNSWFPWHGKIYTGMLREKSRNYYTTGLTPLALRNSRQRLLRRRSPACLETTLGWNQGLDDSEPPEPSVPREALSTCSAAFNKTSVRLETRRPIQNTSAEAMTNSIATGNNT